MLGFGFFHCCDDALVCVCAYSTGARGKGWGTPNRLSKVMVIDTHQNRSHAVMAQRHEPDDSLDDFPTQPWGTRAFIEHVLKPCFPLGEIAWEPACNRGYMVRPLMEYFTKVRATDVHDYGWPHQERVFDFLWPEPVPFTPDWIITNPPFRLAEKFILTARATARLGCAMLVRTAFLESIGRYERLFSIAPPTVVAQFVERLPIIKGRVDRTASTATSYAWLVWANGFEPQPFRWIPPCRSQLERDTDYPEAA